MIPSYDKILFFASILILLGGCYFDEIYQPENVDVNESVGIEIKLAKQIESSTANMMRLFGQAVYYSRRKYGKENNCKT